MYLYFQKCSCVMVLNTFLHSIYQHDRTYVVFDAIATFTSSVASPEPGTFPNVPLNVFNDFMSKNFNNNISLSAVLLIFFTMIENTDLLNLHARQNIKVLPGEKSTQATGWMNFLS